jgi:signal transduction histidine kinase/CHASE3 domain sensor protein
MAAMDDVSRVLLEPRKQAATRLRNTVVSLVSRLPARVQTKLLAAFLAIVLLLVGLGAVGLHVLSGVNQQTKGLITLQRKIEAYRQLQHDTISQLYGVTSALLFSDDRMLDDALRQLIQFGYDFDRLQFVSKSEVALIDQVRQEYGRFIDAVKQVVSLIRAGKVKEARQIQQTQAGPLADRLERLTNKLVNVAEADMVAGIDSSDRAYGASQWIVIGFALGSVLLALSLGYVISWSLIEPMKEIEARLQRIAAGDFTQRVHVVNRDELGALAANVNIASEELGRLYRQIQDQTHDLKRSIEELQALGDVAQAVNSTLNLEQVLATIVAKAAELSEAEAGAIYVVSQESRQFRLRATYGISDALIKAIERQGIGAGETPLGQAADRREPLQIADLRDEAAFALHDAIHEAGYRALLIVPLLREDQVLGALVVRRKEPGLFPQYTVDLLQTFAAQSVFAIQNARLFGELEEKSRELEVASRHKSQFLANMSHELRTPLNSVLGFSEMLADGIYGALPERASAALGKIQANGRHLLNLINDVLDLSKIEAGQLTLSPNDYVMGQIVQSVVASTETQARMKGISLVASIAEGLPVGFGDERRLTQVLLNLMSNAVKFTDQGSVTIAASSSHGMFEVSVRDTGPGIATREHARIFEEFQQVDSSSTREKGGTGLGLAIAKRIVELHGGRVSVESAPGAGSIFRVALPVRTVAERRAA